MKYVFQDLEDEPRELLPEGEYWFLVTHANVGIQTGKGVTTGSSYIQLKLLVSDSAGKHRTTILEKLIDYESVKWKIEGFLRASNYAQVVASELVAGMECDISPRTVVGLRGKCRVAIETITKTLKGVDESTGRPLSEDRDVNRIVQWLPNAKLERNNQVLQKYLELEKKQQEIDKIAASKTVQTYDNDKGRWPEQATFVPPTEKEGCPF